MIHGERILMKRKDQDPLQSYRAKRNADSTPEPFGSTVEPVPQSMVGGKRFMIHHHAARNTHYDLRLEMDGVLRSWAIPKGPSPNMQEKRFAARVEDHPLEYGEFEGHIPEGNYGAGWTIVWDRGSWHCKGDPLAGLEKGKLLFELRGHKLHGMWTLVRMKSGEKDWLFIKERDEYSSDVSTDSFPNGSVFSGLSLDVLNSGLDPAEPLLKELSKLAVTAKKTAGIQLKPMLATASEPFSKKGWLFEIKYDGYRLLCEKEADKVRIISRNGNDLADTFPEIVQALSRLPFEQLIIDGEAVVHGSDGLPSFANMQLRGRLHKRSSISNSLVNLPATLYAFDLLSLNDCDLRQQPLLTRKKLLRQLLPQVGIIRFTDHVETDGGAMYQAAERMGLEGVVGKEAESKYRPGRSKSWLKVRVDRSDDFVVMGYFCKRNGKGISSLLIGQYKDNALVYNGRVGSGLNEAELSQYQQRLRDVGAADPPDSAPSTDEYHWRQPALVCEVRFKQFTSAGQLRHPVFLRHRSDKDPLECVRSETELPEVEVEQESAERTIQFSNLHKIFWPEEGYSKGDIIDYYREISPWLLPWLKDRPLVLTRYPDGIEGKSFFQKDAPEYAPKWLRIEKMWSETTQREIGYFVVDNVESLLYLANMATLPLHVHHSRIGKLEHPDWCVMDLDPKEAPFAHVVQVAKALHRLCDQIELPSYIKTSGSTGLHILLPLDGQFTFQQSRILGELLARIVVEQLPEICTITRSPSQREGKVYIDYLQNGTGKLIASTYCVRPKPGAPVSMPIRWRELNKSLSADRYTIKNAVARMKRLAEDPCLPVLQDRPDMMHVLANLAERFPAAVRSST
jgi:bifunctional non-homologous end joining protein LigD